jgi:hypothetical protein
MPYERKTSDLLVSENLRDMLVKIEAQSLVARLLLKKRHSKEELVDGFVNWISISSQDSSKISYLTEERAQALSEDELWTSSRRFHAKPGGFISKVFRNIPSKEVELFSTLFRNLSCRPEFSLNIVRGERIRDFYHYETYANDSGSLGASCMRYDSCQEYMDLYVENRDKISMLVMLDCNDNLIGRAILWDFEGYKIMDRIYTINDEKYSYYFKEWALKNCYLYKSAQNWFDTMNFNGVDGKKQHLKLEIKLDNHKHYRYPYMDTFKFYSPDKGTFSNYQPDDNFYTICSPDGSKYGSDYLVIDKLDGVFRYRHDAVYVHHIDGWTSSGNVNYSNVLDQYILCDESTYDSYINDYIFRDENLNDDRVNLRREYLKERENSRKSKDTSDDINDQYISIIERLTRSFTNSNLPDLGIDLDQIVLQNQVSDSNNLQQTHVPSGRIRRNRQEEELES